MTWKEFKEWAEKNGAKDTDKIHYIDISWPDESFMTIEHDEHGLNIS